MRSPLRFATPVSLAVVLVALVWVAAIDVTGARGYPSSGTNTGVSRATAHWVTMRHPARLAASGVRPVLHGERPHLKPTVSPSPRVLARSSAWFPITRNGVTLAIPVYVSQSLSAPDTRVTTAVVVLHGLSGGAAKDWDSAAAGLKDVRGVLLVAPKFAIATEAPAATQLYWPTAGAWSKGGQSSAAGRAWSLSSFAVLDKLVGRLRSTFASLRTVVVIGHSAGGQMAQRYAAASGDSGLRFVVMNPGSYLYFSPERPTAGGGYAVPAAAPSDYDDYKYGLEDLDDVPYVEAVGASALRSRYAAARVTYLLGELDTDTNASDLDVSAPAMLQGTCRLQRGQAFFGYLGFTYGASIYERHTMSVVPGVAHSAGGMLRSAAARAAMTQ